MRCPWMCRRRLRARFKLLDYAAKPPWNSIPGRVNYAVEQLTRNILTTYDSTTAVFNANQCPAGVFPTI